MLKRLTLAVVVRVSVTGARTSETDDDDGLAIPLIPFFIESEKWEIEYEHVCYCDAHKRYV